jgi:hypothetical protein
MPATSDAFSGTGPKPRWEQIVGAFEFALLTDPELSRLHKLSCQRLTDDDRRQLAEIWETDL